MASRPASVAGASHSGYQTFQYSEENLVGGQRAMASKGSYEEPVRRKASVGSAFETQTIVTQVPVKVEKGHTPHAGSTTFASQGLDEYYKPSEQWEGLHRYDPDFAWEPSEEKRLVRKVPLAVGYLARPGTLTSLLA